MNDETTRIAERYGITEKCASLERDLLGIDGVTGVEFDLNGFLDDIHQVIVLVGYDFHIVTRKLRLAVDVVNARIKYDKSAFSTLHLMSDAWFRNVDLDVTVRAVFSYIVEMEG